MNKKNQPHLLGVFSHQETAQIFYTLRLAKEETLFLNQSPNGLDFQKAQAVFLEGGEKPGSASADNFRVARVDTKYFLTYTLKEGEEMHLCGAISEDLYHWQTVGTLSEGGATGMVVPDYQYRGRYVLYGGRDALEIAFSSDLKNWERDKKPLLRLDKGLSLIIGNLFLTDAGILLVYLLEGDLDGHRLLSLKTLLLDPKNPKRILWEGAGVIWDQPEEWEEKKARFIGIINLDGQTLSYWQAGAGQIFILLHASTKALLKLKPERQASLKRAKQNPLLQPNPRNFWESKAVFNPAAIYDENKVHIIYRAIGDQDVSVLGYASSQDGLHIGTRLLDPLYVPTEPFECRDPKVNFCSLAYLSGGGGGGGCEDPRIVRIGDRFYMTYVAYDGSGPPRIALTSIAVEDFRKHRWDWKKPVLISPPNVVDKNACLLPEKIKGKYVIFHRIFPDILIDFVDDLNFDGKTKWLEGKFKISPRPNAWDSRKIGIGPPPLKTKDGWLLIYQAVGDQDAGRYKMGAMLLALDDPRRVLARPPYPILEPTQDYENEGFKPGVVYPCGAVSLKNELIVYYGGADTVVCAAKTNLPKFLKGLKYNEPVRLESVNTGHIHH